MRDTQKVVDIIRRLEQKIIDRISPESVAAYLHMKEEIKSGKDVSNCYLFKFIFQTFYRMDQTQTTKLFREEFYKKMQEYKNVKLDEKSFLKLLEFLYHFPTPAGRKEVQFSFATKFFNTLDPTNWPVYDAETARVFNMTKPYTIRDYDRKLKRFITNYNQIRQTFADVITGNLLETTLDLFNQKFPSEQKKIPVEKKLDFIFWACGRLI